MNKTKIFQITDREYWLDKRRQFVTSTESSSLFGLQMPAQPTAYELWHIKNGLIDVADVDKDWFVDAGYLWFIALPDDFKIWGIKDLTNE